ncbi:uncharacterized protein LOC118513462 [Anopheles stephensi]|uniref:uncharacterized protein LOC118507938 n=1 Tax=Anopheles stephensi TaxID=30069 RepID=UPI001658BC7F|nr:uncharacterized protein LOC118507938 [Anopheles stephensi]XP_035915576.1 uncharacterized protein LOC118513462 [Anopheles stephensi]
MEKSGQKQVKNPIQEVEEVLQLIELVKSYTCLWKDTDRMYKNAEIRHQAWKEIANVMGRSHEVVHAKWKNLSNTYRRIRKDISRSMVTGAGTDDIVEHSWYAYEHMAFLQDTTVPRPTLNSVSNLYK